MNYDHVITGKPVDKTASRVTRSGEHFEFKRGDHVTVSRTPLPTRPIPLSSLNSGNFVRYTGKKIGRLTVVGLAEKKKGRKSCLWVCRCSCGNFVHRTSKYLRESQEGLHRKPMCDECDEIEYRKGRQEP
jgi:hypothetical protein